MYSKILIVGGTGMLGRPVVWKFIRDGYSVRVMTHSPERAKNFFGDSVETVTGDVTDPASLSNPMNGCDAVYINLGAKMDINKLDAIERQGTANVAEAAGDKGIKRIGMISGLNVGEADLKVPFYRAKAAAEKALMESGISYTIFRCCWFYESLPLYVQGKKAVMLGNQPHPVSWIAAADYAAMVSKAYSTAEAENKIFHVRGIEKRTIPDALVEFCNIVVPDAKLSPIPLWLASVASFFSRKGKMKGLIQFMRYFDRHPETEVQDDTEKILGPALTTLKDWAQEYKRQLLAGKG